MNTSISLSLTTLTTGSDEEAIMAVLGARTNKQRQEIAAKFQQEYDKVRYVVIKF